MRFPEFYIRKFFYQRNVKILKKIILCSCDGEIILTGLLILVFEYFSTYVITNTQSFPGNIDLVYSFCAKVINPQLSYV